MDVNELRRARLHMQVGKSLVEKKMPESRFCNELMERGAQIVITTPD